MKILNLHGFRGEADNKNYKVLCNVIPMEYVEQYCELSEQAKNDLAYALCSDADTIISDNYGNCMKLSRNVTIVRGGHSFIENLEKHLKDSLERIMK